MAPLSEGFVIPSLAYHAPDGSLLTGAAAQQAATDPARLGRGFKRRLGDPTPLLLGGAAYSPTALMAAQLRGVLDQIIGAMGGAPASIALTCPAIWGPYRREQFADVTRLAGLDDAHVITEPEAAATHYSRERTLGEGEVVAVYDLGGGTLDTTVLRMRSDGMEILGTPEGIEHLGGMDFDDALLSHLDARLEGAISRLDPADPTAAEALAQIRSLCVSTKISLSTEPDVTITVPLPSGPRELTITRREFNAVIRPSVELTVGALRRTVSSAGLHPDDLSAVLLAGGSSRIPLVNQLVFEEFDKPVRVTQHPKFTVALGAATAATRAASGAPAAGQAPEAASGTDGAEPITPAPTRKVSRRGRWGALLAGGAVTAAAVLVTTLIVDDSDVVPAGAPAGTALQNDGGQASGRPNPDTPLTLFDNELAEQYHAFIGSNENWGGSEVVGKAVSHEAIEANIEDGLRVMWRGESPGQVYLQSVNEYPDLSGYTERNGALVFDVQVNEAATGPSTVGAHCRYPCGGTLDTTNLFGQLPVGEQRTVKIPLRCFVEKGLDPTQVDTPFVVYSEGPFDATFRNIRWEADVAEDSDATPCAAVP
ncbi:Hsp70 family protein [Prauserella sp. ASG 168]|uniref:Hsp70 family protein n=2 Tax=Prauserella cavernicola TaxID=2800127 RepID=A0A934QWF3_9PSEU|nr:Hsp70 family protein [Prauserella cavernicola]